jgi:malonyl-CoA/methylmalonyl-CoA synthetase
MPTMTDHNLYSRLARAFPTDGSALFLDLVDARGLTYGEVAERSGRLLNVLRYQGVARGDRVVVQVHKSIEAVLLYLACLRAGAVYVPLNTAYTPTEVAFFLGDATPRLFVCTPDKRTTLEPVAAAAGARVLSLGPAGEGDLGTEAAAAASSDDIETVEADDLAAILYTSGTTGRSKGAMLSHANLVSNAEVLHAYWHWQPGDVLLHALPIFHVHGLFVALHCALLGGSRVIFLPRFDVETVLDMLPGATVMMGVPTFYTRLLEREEFSRERCANMRLFVSGSAPLLVETHRAFEARTGHRILERYGMTEAGMITSNPFDGERVAGSVGYPLPGIRVRVADAEGREMPRGEPGTLEIAGPNVFRGYWQMPEKTAEEFRPDGWFVTGDLGCIDADGYLHIVGRARDLIISGGFNVYPKEVEGEIDRLPGVRESAVIGVPHPDLGEGVTAVVVLDGADDLDEPAVIAALRDRLARFKQPKRVFFVDELPRNTMGKVQKNLLRETYRNIFR